MMTTAQIGSVMRISAHFLSFRSLSLSTPKRNITYHLVRQIYGAPQALSRAECRSFCRQRFQESYIANLLDMIIGHETSVIKNGSGPVGYRSSITYLSNTGFASFYQHKKAGSLNKFGEIMNE